MKIAGNKTSADWQSSKASLVVGGNQTLWKEVHQEFFLKRLSLRYLNPIETLQERGNREGEGFSIVALQCVLLEFLASTVKGKSYLHNHKPKTPPDPKDPFYSNSKELFVEFLHTYSPFKSSFNRKTAEDFYTGVRCGLVHEARTKNGWIIRANKSSKNMIDLKSKKVNRYALQDAIIDFLKWYEKELLTNKSVQEAFIVKFDNLSQP